MSPHCQNCGSQVSPAFQRVMGNNDGEVKACIHCAPRTVGEAAGGVDASKLTGVAHRR